MCAHQRCPRQRRGWVCAAEAVFVSYLKWQGSGGQLHTADLHSGVLQEAAMTRQVSSETSWTEIGWRVRVSTAADAQR